ncbi:hypothetical protein Afil01_24060 [Actinorhabdospora filicis]|uniref:Uncharacterized protein n=1 Tax=Actinorhabdospora filicis TaxID=1785913 RepID=A0A9W6W8H8_9ACTN|nr:hypothetical protein Afil01_24060 [Actinorhabdospora filicis]
MCFVMPPILFTRASSGIADGSGLEGPQGIADTGEPALHPLTRATDTGSPTSGNVAASGNHP